MITDDQMIKALKTVRQYCKESTECCKCVCHCECDMWFEGRPDIWQIPGDEDDDGIIADIGELNEDDE